MRIGDYVIRPDANCWVVATIKSNHPHPKAAALIEEGHTEKREHRENDDVHRSSDIGSA